MLWSTAPGYTPNLPGLAGGRHSRQGWAPGQGLSEVEREGPHIRVELLATLDTVQGALGWAYSSD